MVTNSQQKLNMTTTTKTNKRPAGPWPLAVKEARLVLEKAGKITPGFHVIRKEPSKQDPDGHKIYLKAKEIYERKTGKELGAARAGVTSDDLYPGSKRLDIHVHKGELTRYGWHFDESATVRHKALDATVRGVMKEENVSQHDAALTVWRRINLLAVWGKHAPPKEKAVLTSDKAYLKRKYDISATTKTKTTGKRPKTSAKTSRKGSRKRRRVSRD